MLGILFILLVLFAFGGYMSLSARVLRLEEQLKGGATAPAAKQSEPEPVSVPEPVMVKEEPAPKRSRDTDLEARWGGKLFTAVGGIAVLFGAGFFLRYAFENNLITPPMRLALGFGLGVFCLVLGEWLRKKYASYGQALMGLGLGVFYLTWYASLHLYHLMPATAAFIGMICVTALGLVLALHLDSQPLGMFAQIGGLLTPILIGGDNNPPVLFFYLLLLNITVLIASFYKAWRGITLVSMLGTAFVFLIWFNRHFVPSEWGMVEGFITAFFAVFVTAGFARYVMQRGKQDEYDLAVTALNPFLYAVATYAVVPRAYDDVVGWWFALLGAAYSGVAYLIQGAEERDRRYRSFLAVIGCAFLAVAVPLSFDGRPMTIAWAVLAVAITAWSYLLRSVPLRAAAQILGFIAMASAGATLFGGSSGSIPWLNGRFLTVLFVAAALIASATIHWMRGVHGAQKIAKGSDTDVIRFTMTLDLLKAYFLLCMVFYTEIAQFYDDRWTIAALSLLALAAGWTGCMLRATGLRVAAYFTFLLLGLRFIVEHPALTAGSTPVWNMRIAMGLTLILSVGALEYLIRRVYAEAVSKEERSGVRTTLFIGIHLLGLWLVSTELTSWFDLQMRSAVGEARNALRGAKNSLLSVAWTVYALALLGFGILRKSVVARQFAMTLFAITVLKAFLFDTSGLSNFYRFISFMTLGVLLLLSGYLYNRYKDRIRQFVTEGGKE